MPEDNKFELLNEDAMEIIENPPGWFFRWGILFFSILFVVFLIFSIFFRYPDIIVAPVTLTSFNPPAKIVAKTSGLIKILNVKDKQIVDSNCILGVIQSTANYKQILKLDSLLKVADNAEKILEYIWPQDLILEEIQNYYTEFIKNINEYKDFISLSYYPKKIKYLENELIKFNNYYNILSGKYDLLKQNYALAHKKFKRDSILKIQNIISEVEMENSKMNMLEKLDLLTSTKVELSSAELQKEKILQQIIDLQLEFQKVNSEHKNVLLKSRNDLLSEVDRWKQKYLLVSPIYGIVTFTKFWNVNQHVNEGELILTIIPEKEQELIGRLKVVSSGAGKIKEGQNVNVKFDNYPFQEFGIVEAYVKSISLIPVDDLYTVEIVFHEGLKTNYNKNLEFSQEMPGIAEIIVENRSLFSRMISPLKTFIGEQKNYYKKGRKN